MTACNRTSRRLCNNSRRPPGSPKTRPSRRFTRPCSSATAMMIQAWLAPSTGSLVGRLARAYRPFQPLPMDLYLSLYTRRPTGEERAEVARYLADRGKERVPALHELAWALLASTEFRFNH